MVSSAIPAALLLSFLSAAPAAPGRTLWLVRPLYPGQELLTERVEESIRQLMPKDARAAEVIGRRELEQHLQGKAVDLACILGDARCADAIAAVITSLGFQRVVLVKGGQDEAGYRFQVASFTTTSPDVAAAEGSGRELGRALLGALVKVVPLAATVNVVTEPPGLTVFVDGEKVGQTPLSTQVLPGERVIRLEGPFHVPTEIKQTFPVRGRVTFQPRVESLPARLVVAATPAGTKIFVDGEAAGTDRLERGVSAGEHLVRLELPDHEPLELPVQVKPGETATVEKALKPTSGALFRQELDRLQKEAYGRSWDVILLADLQGYPGAELGFEWFSAPNTATGSVSGPVGLRSLQLEVGSYDGFVGFTLLGLMVGEVPDPLSFTLPDNPDPVVARVQRLGISAFHPRFRFAFWRAQAFAELGLDVQILRIQPEAGDRLTSVNLGLSGRAALRAFLVQGLFLEAAYGARYGLAIHRAPLSHGFMGGVGYAF
jgi:hypothetical protein